MSNYNIDYKKNLEIIAKIDPEKAVILPLGGCGEFGMNCTLYSYGNNAVLVDAGVLFAEPYMLGIDGIIPSFFDHIGTLANIKAYVITHGHEDHIGALPYFYKKKPAPIYATAWTVSLIERRMSNFNIPRTAYELYEIEPDGELTVGKFNFKYIPVNHSIPMACALSIRVGGLQIFHTGDFKIDRAPIYEEKFNYKLLRTLAAQGVDLLLADSTNAPSPGWGEAEGQLIPNFVDIFQKTSGRIIFTTFSSNLWRVLTILKACKLSARKLCVIGRGMESTLDLGRKHGFLDKKLEGLLVDVNEISSIPKKQLVLALSGSQGEYRSAMLRYAHSEISQVLPEKADTVIFSSRTIPGNEKALISVMNKLCSLGVEIISANKTNLIHVSGHAFAEEIKSLITTLKPKNYLPIHGGFYQQNANRLIAQSAFKHLKNTAIPSNGDLFQLDKNGVSLLGKLDIDQNFIDSESRQALDKETMRARLKIGELGAAFYSATIKIKGKTSLKHSQLTTIGLKLPPTIKRDILEAEVDATVVKGLDEFFRLRKDEVSHHEISEIIRLSVRKVFTSWLNKKIIVTVHLHVVD
ncbi:MAG: ribonuclease J [Oligoflexales bacterium]|nr:ribonuclease J [Oligoflexales bacterium]